MTNATDPDVNMCFISLDALVQSDRQGRTRAKRVGERNCDIVLSI